MTTTDVRVEPASIEDREARVTEIVERIVEIDSEYAGTVMPDEVRDEWNELNAERDNHDATIKELKRRRERIRSLAGNESATERASTDTPAFVPKRGDSIFDLTRIRAESTSDEDLRNRLHDNAKRALERAHFPEFAGTKARVQEHIEDLLFRDDDEGTFAKQMLATGNPTYERAFGKLLTRGGYSLTPEENSAIYRAQAVSPDTSGGFAVPFSLDPTVILTSDGEVSPLRQIARVETIVGKEWQGITSDGIIVSRSGEGAESGDNSFDIDQPTERPKRVIADVRFSIEIDQDWRQMRSEISRLLADAKDVEEAQSFVLGSGTGNNPSGVVGTLDASSNVVQGAGLGTLTLDELLELEAELPVRFRNRGRFMANKFAYQSVRALGSGSDGSELWVRLPGKQPDELLGYPSHEASAMASPGAANVRWLLFGDFKQFLIVDRLGMIVEINPHIVGANGRWTGQRAVVAAWRNSSKILVDNAFRILTEPAT